MFARNHFTTKSIHSLGARFNDDDGGEGNQDISIDLNNLSEEQLNQVMQSEGANTFITTQADTLANERVGKLESNSKKLLAQLKGSKEKASQFDAFAQQLEDQADFDDVKAGNMTVQQLLDKRNQSARAVWQKDYDAQGQELTSAKEQIESLQGNIRQTQLNGTIGDAALANKHFRQTSKNHFLKAASEIWQSQEDGSLIARDENDNVIMGKNGQPITPSEWTDGLPDNPEFEHYFNFPQGSNSKPGSNGQGGKVMSRAEFQNAMALADSKEESSLIAARKSGELRIV